MSRLRRGARWLGRHWRKGAADLLMFLVGLVLFLWALAATVLAPVVARYHRSREYWNAAGLDPSASKWGVRYAIRYNLMEYPHRVAYVLLGLGCFFALSWGAVLYNRVDDQNTQIKAQAVTAKRQARQLAELVVRIQRDRRTVSKAFCATINGDTAGIRTLILQGARSSRAFEPLYRQYGAPTYPERLAAARKAAALFPRLDCQRYLRQIDATTPPPPAVPAPANP